MELFKLWDAGSIENFGSYQLSEVAGELGLPQPFPSMPQWRTANDDSPTSRLEFEGAMRTVRCGGLHYIGPTKHGQAPSCGKSNPNQRFVSSADMYKSGAATKNIAAFSNVHKRRQ